MNRQPVIKRLGIWLALIPIVAVAVASMLPVASAAGASDTTAPELMDFDFSPKTADTSASAVQVTLSARIVDDTAGVADSSYTGSPTQVRFESPSGQFVDGLFISDVHLVSGTRLDGEYESTIELPAMSEQGTWKVVSFLLVDQVGNQQSLSEEDLAGLGFPTQLEQVGPGDNTPPVLEEFGFSPQTVDTTLEPATVTLTARITDDAAGVADSSYTSSPSQVRFRSPSGQIVDGLFVSDQHLTSGNPTDGAYQSKITLPKASEQGTWTVEYFLLVDKVGNSRYLHTSELKTAGFPTDLEQAGAGDTTAPELQAFEFSPVNIDTTSSSAEVTLKARITDDVAGVADSSYQSSPTQVRFVSPSGQMVDGLFISDVHRVSGTHLDGRYETKIVLPKSSEQGTWKVEYFLLVDQAGNTRYVDADELVEMGSYPAFAVDPFHDIYDTPFFQDIGWLIVNDVTRGCNPPANDQFCPNRPVTRGQMAAFLNRFLQLPAGTKVFDDSDGHLFQRDIAALADASITRGCNPPANNRFCPDDGVTRGQMAAFLFRALGGVSPTTVDREFVDTVGHVFASEIHWLAEVGITRGCNPPANDRFCPDDPVTRGQMAAFLRRAANR